MGEVFLNLSVMLLGLFLLFIAFALVAVLPPFISLCWLVTLVLGTMWLSLRLPS